MPELPDVESYRRFLKRHLHKRIEGVAIADARALDGVTRAELERALPGHELERARRHGKYLFVTLDGGRILAFHFGMTGRFERFTDPDEEPKHQRLRIDFKDGERLAFVDQRLLGRVRLVDEEEAFLRRKKLGPDALSVSAATFRERLCGRRGAVKSALMDQSVLAGIGNVYSDEILYHAKIHPRTPTDTLDEASLERLFRQLRRVLKTAIDKGAGVADITRRAPRTWLLARRRRGARCGRCGGKVATLRIQGRTAYYCPNCQPAP